MDYEAFRHILYIILVFIWIFSVFQKKERKVGLYPNHDHLMVIK